MARRARSPSPTVCAVHGAEPSVARCRFCQTAMCDACLRFYVGRSPSCVRCAHELATRRTRRLALTVAFDVVAAFVAFVLVRRSDEPVVWGSAALLGIAAVPLTIRLVRSSRIADPALLVEERTVREQPLVAYEAEDGGSPYRARILRVEQALAPKLSVRATAFTLLGAIAFVCVVLPTALHLPRWLEWEAVVLGLFAILSVLSATLLYRGFRIEDDHRFHAAELPWRDVGDRTPVTWPSKDGCDPSGCADASGCELGEGGCEFVVGGGLALLAAAVLGVLSFSVAWLTVEVALPLAFIGFYEVVRIALVRIARDRHACRGALAPSVAWGLVYATLATAPLALLVYAFHVHALRAVH